MRTILRRLDKVGDLWEPVLGAGVDLEDCLDRLARRRRRLSLTSIPLPVPFKRRSLLRPNTYTLSDDDTSS